MSIRITSSQISRDTLAEIVIGILRERRAEAILDGQDDPSVWWHGGSHSAVSIVGEAVGRFAKLPEANGCFVLAPIDRSKILLRIHAIARKDDRIERTTPPGCPRIFYRIREGA